MAVTDSLSGSTHCTSAAWLIQASANVMEEKSLMETSWHSAEACSGLQSTRATWAFSKPIMKFSTPSEKGEGSAE